MQTFVPFPDIAMSLHVLDRERLNSQRSEARVILNGLLGKHSGWMQHPTMAMWRGYEPTLALYAHMADAEWRSRGYKSTQEPIIVPGALLYPWWWGLHEVHGSHQQALITKLPKHYLPHFPDRKLQWRGYQYVWPDASEPGRTVRGEWMP